MTRHASYNGEQTLCGRYCGWHAPLASVRPVEGWRENVTCKRCRKSLRFKAETKT